MPHDTENPNELASLMAVVITYFPNETLLENIRALHAQVSQVLIIDNSPDPEEIGVLKKIETLQGIRLIRNGRNLGIAVALNQGAREALASKFEWVATFDQDSMVTPEFFLSLADAYKKCPFKNCVAMLAPVICDSDLQVNLLRKGFSKPLFVTTRTAMTSGQVIKTEIFNKAGWFDETFFMDYVDYDFCLRLGKQRYKILRANRAWLLHKLGSQETHSFCGFSLKTKAHNPRRRYYIMRNRLTVYRRFAFYFPRWCIWDFIWIFIELGKVICLEEEKLSKLRNVWNGAMDGFTGRGRERKAGGI